MERTPVKCPHWGRPGVDPEVSDNSYKGSDTLRNRVCLDRRTQDDEEFKAGNHLQGTVLLATLSRPLIIPLEIQTEPGGR